MFRNNIQKNKEVPEKELIDWLYNIWYDESLISKEIIYNSFKYCGISNSLQGWEDDILNWPTDKCIALFHKLWSLQLDLLPTAGKQGIISF